MLTKTTAPPLFTPAEHTPTPTRDSLLILVADIHHRFKELEVRYCNLAPSVRHDALGPLAEERFYLASIMQCRPADNDFRLNWLTRDPNGGKVETQKRGRHEKSNELCPIWVGFFDELVRAKHRLDRLDPDPDYAQVQELLTSAEDKANWIEAKLQSVISVSKLRQPQVVCVNETYIDKGWNNLCLEVMEGQPLPTAVARLHNGVARYKPSTTDFDLEGRRGRRRWFTFAPSLFPGEDEFTFPPFCFASIFTAYDEAGNFDDRNKDKVDAKRRADLPDITQEQWRVWVDDHEPYLPTRAFVAAIRLGCRLPRWFEVSDDPLYFLLKRAAAKNPSMVGPKGNKLRVSTKRSTEEHSDANLADSEASTAPEVSTRTRRPYVSARKRREGAPRWQPPAKTSFKAWPNKRGPTGVGQQHRAASSRTPVNDEASDEANGDPSEPRQQEPTTQRSVPPQSRDGKDGADDEPPDSQFSDGIFKPRQSQPYSKLFSSSDDSATDTVRPSMLPPRRSSPYASSRSFTEYTRAGPLPKRRSSIPSHTENAGGSSSQESKSATDGTHWRPQSPEQPVPQRSQTSVFEPEGALKEYLARWEILSSEDPHIPVPYHSFTVDGLVSAAQHGQRMNYRYVAVQRLAQLEIQTFFLRGLAIENKLESDELRDKCGRVIREATKLGLKITETSEGKIVTLRKRLRKEIANFYPDALNRRTGDSGSLNQLNGSDEAVVLIRTAIQELYEKSQATETKVK